MERMLPQILYCRSTLIGAALYLVLIIGSYGSVVVGTHSLDPSLLQSHGITDEGAWNYDGRRPSNTFNLDHADPGYTQWPMNKFIGQLYLDGDLPLWNPYQGSGEPLAGQYSTRAFFPLQILQNISPPETWDYFLLGRVWLAAIFTFLFLTRLGLHSRPAFLGGLIYMFSGTFSWFLTLEQLSNISLMIPLLMLCMEELAQKMTRRWVAAVAGCTALVLLGGQPETALYVLSFGGLYYLFRAIQCHGAKMPKVYLSIAAASLLGLALAAPQVLPFLDHLQQGFTLHSPDSKMGSRDAISWSWLATILAPNLHNLPRPLPVTPLNGLWDYVGGFVGSTTITLIVLGLFQRQAPRRATFVFFVAVGTVLLLKHAGIAPFYWIGHLPVFDLVWSHRWAGPVWQFSFAAAAAIALSMLSHKQQQSPAKAHQIVLIIGAAFTALIATIVFIVAKMTPSPFIAVSSAITLSTIIVISAVTAFISPNSLQTLKGYFLSTDQEQRNVRRLGVAALGVSGLLAGHLWLAIESQDDDFLVAEGWRFFAIAGPLLAAFVAIAIMRPQAMIAGAVWYDQNKASTICLALITLVLGVSVLQYPEILESQMAHARVVVPSALTTALISTVALLWLMARRPADAWRDGAVIILILNELLFAIPHGFGAEDELLRLIPWGLGLGAVVVMSLRIKWAAVSLVGGLFATLVAIDYQAERGLPKSHNPFTAPPYVEVLKKDPLARVMGGGGVLMPTFSSALGIQDVRYIQSVSIKSYQHFADTYLQDAPALRGNLLWFTGIPARKIEDLSPRETLWFHDLSTQFDENENTMPIAVERVKHDFARNLKSYSFLGVRYLLLPSWADLASVKYLLPDKQELPLIYDGEVKIYENTQALPRAFVVHDVQTVEDFKAAQALANQQDILLLKTAVIEEAPPANIQMNDGVDSSASIVSYAPRRVEVSVAAQSGGLLVLTDTHYPGWKVSIDGIDGKIMRVNGVVRGVFVTAGKHNVVFTYLPTSFQLGLALMLLSALTCLGLMLGRRENQAK